MWSGDVGALLLALATLIVGGGGVASLVKLIQERHRPKLDNRAVEVATAGDSVGMSLELATTAMAQVAQFRTDVEALRAQVKDAEGRLEATEAKATDAERRAARAEQAVDAWASWGENVVRNWPTIRQSETPPALPQIVRIPVSGDNGREHNAD